MAPAGKKPAGKGSDRADLGPAITSLDELELAARLFVKIYATGGGRTAEHQAECAIDAARAFLTVYETHRLTKE